MSEFRDAIAAVFVQITEEETGVPWRLLEPDELVPVEPEEGSVDA